MKISPWTNKIQVLKSGESICLCKVEWQEVMSRAYLYVCYIVGSFSMKYEDRNLQRKRFFTNALDIFCYLTLKWQILCPSTDQKKMMSELVAKNYVWRSTITGFPTVNWTDPNFYKARFGSPEGISLIWALLQN